LGKALRGIRARLSQLLPLAEFFNLNKLICASSTTAATTGSDSLLPSAKPGECYARILIPAKFESKTEEMLKTAESERLEIILATYEWVEETIQTEGSSYKLVPVSGDFKTKTTKYQTSEGRRYWATSMDIGAAVFDIEKPTHRKIAWPGERPTCVKDKTDLSLKIDGNSAT